jgi:hypothetical protein
MLPAVQCLFGNPRLITDGKNRLTIEHSLNQFTLKTGRVLTLDYNSPTDQPDTTLINNYPNLGVTSGHCDSAYPSFNTTMCASYQSITPPEEQVPGDPISDAGKHSYREVWGIHPQSPEPVSNTVPEFPPRQGECLPVTAISRRLAI